MRERDDMGADVPRIYDAMGRPYAPAGLPPSFTDHIRQILEREIIEGHIAPGERITEEDLAQRIGVSRTPVREAMRALEGQGLIQRRRGQSTSVAERTRPDEARALYELRGAVEGHLAARAAEAIGDEDLETVTDLQRRFRRLLETEATVDTRALVTLDSDLHWTIYNATSSTLVATLRSYWGRVQRELYDPIYRTDPHVFVDQHDELLDALTHHRPDAAEAAMRTHISSGWAALELSFATLAARDEGEAP